MRPTGIPAKATRASRLAEDVRQAILDGKMPPGAKINLDRLRDAYGVSLSPLREAVARLTHTGLVELEDQRGYRIADVSPDNLAEVTRLRAELESLAVGIATNNAGLDWEAAVMAAQHRLARTDPAQNPAAWDAAHTNLHTTLAAGAGMPILSEFCLVLMGLAERYRRICGAIATPDDLAEHAEIAGAAAVRRDAGTASRLLRDHIERGGERLLHQFRTMTGAMP